MSRQVSIFATERALGKIRAGERGWEPAALRLVQAGADSRRAGEEPGAWLDRVLPAFRSVRHPGNHIYVWNWTARIQGRSYPRRTT